jgi:hypothetical protein
MLGGLQLGQHNKIDPRTQFLKFPDWGVIWNQGFPTPLRDTLIYTNIYKYIYIYIYLFMVFTFVIYIWSVPKAATKRSGPPQDFHRTLVTWTRSCLVRRKHVQIRCTSRCTNTANSVSCAWAHGKKHWQIWCT